MSERAKTQRALEKLMFARTAREAYAAQSAAVGEALEEVRRLATAHKARFEKDGAASWGFVGDADLALELLGRARLALGGKEGA